jgi:pSer/pThr/pTyr-binding forkhead associated (FHA) protein
MDRWNRRLLVLLCALALALLAPLAAGAAGNAAPTGLARVPALVQPSIVYLSIDWTSAIYDTNARDYVANGDAIAEAAFQCSGFFVSPDGDIVTASHCTQYRIPGSSNPDEVQNALVESAASYAHDNGYFRSGVTLKQALKYADDFFRVKKQQYVATAVWSYAADGSNPQHLPAREVGYRLFNKGDVALLKIGAQNTIPLSIVTGDVPDGTPIDVVGFPGEVDNVTDANKINPNFNNGQISAHKTIENVLVPVYGVSGTAAPGMSGGPAVTASGGVVGVTSFGSSASFSFISPSSLVDELLKDKGVPETGSADATLLRQGITAVFDGKRNDALNALDQVVDRQPDWQLAATYRAKALLLPKESSGFPIWALVLIIVAGVLALGGVGALLWRRGTLPFARRDGKASRPGPRPSSQTTVSHSIAPDAPVLKVLSGARTGERFPLRAQTSIGREKADIVLDDSEVSARHAVLRLLNGALEVSDAGSSNGTFVNGSKISASHTLKKGDVVRVGQTAFEVEMGAPAESRAAPTPVLVMMTGAREGERFPLTSQLSLGRENADIVLDDTEASRLHAVVRFANGRAEVTDAGSSNGTFVNGSRIDGARELVHGDLIRVGQTSLTIEMPTISSATVIGAAPPATLPGIPKGQ